MLRSVVVVSIAIVSLGCSTGYMKADELKSKDRGPEACEARCTELGMEMGALVLVSDQLPACVCQRRGAPSPPERAREGASGSVGGYVVVAAAAAAAQRQIVAQQQQQQQHFAPHVR